MSFFIRLHPDDDVVIARQQLMSGTSVENIAVRGLIPPGHKIATRAIETGQAVRRYNRSSVLQVSRLRPANTYTRTT